MHLVTAAHGVPNCPFSGAVRHLPHPSRVIQDDACRPVQGLAQPSPGRRCERPVTSVGGRIPSRRRVSRRCRAHNRTELRHSVGSTPRSTTRHRCRRDHRERTRPSPCQARPSSRIARSAAIPPLLPPGIYADAGEKFKREALELRRPSPRTHSAAGGARGSLRAGAAHHNRPVTLSDFGHRAEGEDTSPPREETATADDDLVGVVDVALVADVIKPADVGAVSREHSVARGGREESAECRVCPVAPPVPATLLHGREE